MQSWCLHRGENLLEVLEFRKNVFLFVLACPVIPFEVIFGGTRCLQIYDLRHLHYFKGAMCVCLLVLLDVSVIQHN